MTDNIHTAINKVMKEVGYVKKEFSQRLGYSFAGEAALIEALRPALVENQITLYQMGIKDKVAEIYQAKSGATMNRVMVNAIYRMTHAPSQSSIDIVVPGEGTDPGDKATNKAETSALKILLRQTFIIETGDDPEKQPSTEQERSTQEQEPKPGQFPSSPAVGPADGKWHSGNASAVRSFLAQHEIINDDANTNHVAQLMNLSPFKPGGKIDITWFQIYRKRRDEDLSSKEAAEIANSEWEA